LRWAYNSWPKEPHLDSRFSKRSAWGSGDTYLVYPYNRSSIRFERLIDGIEVFEKVRVLRAARVDMREVDRVLEKIRATNINDPNQPWPQILSEARTALDAVSRK